MKIASLLNQYLYTHHTLALPGIGTFSLDPSALVPAENSKQRNIVIEGISFKSDPTVKESPELIAYISAQSGKMKALASADLESHIQLALQFLNMGKPFLFDGIGTVVKVKQKAFEFVPMAVTIDRVKEQVTKETQRSVQKEEGTGKYESFLSDPKPAEGWRRPVVALFILAGVGLAIWGGYAISKKRKPISTTQTAAAVSIAVEPDTLAMKKQREDSLQVVLAAQRTHYKYVLEVAKRKRAEKRYNQLLKNFWKVELETADSVQYKVVMNLPVLNADTTHVLDSLTVFLGRKVYIEHQN